MRRSYNFAQAAFIALENKKRLARQTQFERVTFAFGGKRLTASHDERFFGARL
jgi:hypothetical protein